MFASVSLLFFAIPHPTVPLLVSVGGFNHCFWVSLGLPYEGPTPLSSPTYPSITSPPAKPCLSCLAPSITFQKKLPPFCNPQPLSLAPLFDSWPCLCLVSTLFILPIDMVFDNKARVQALGTLFDAGMEDAQGRTYSQKRAANGLGVHCLGTITRV